MKLKVLLVLVLIAQSLMAQDYFPKNTGVKETNTNYVAFTNATLYTTPTQVQERATLLIKDGKVVRSGKNISLPQNTVVIDLEGKHVYPSFIDMYTTFGITTPKREGGGRSPQYDAGREGFYWNDHIRPDQRGVEVFEYSAKDAKEMREQGFGTVNTHIADGIARGTGVLVALNDDENDSKRILEDDSSTLYSFSKSVKSSQNYPTSLMGALALLRQFHYDADWYAKGNSTTKDRAIEAFNETKNLPAIFVSESKSNNVRVDEIGDAFNRNYIILGGGDEYESITAIKNTGASYILPINFPEAFDVSDPYYANYISLDDMREWNQAPTNPKVMADAAIPFALTTHNLKKPEDFFKMLARAFEYGFDKTKALEALTTIPAQLLNKSNEIGTLEKGKWANFIITSGPLFEKETTLYENWVQGKKHEIKSMNVKNLAGIYNLKADGKTFDLEISGDVVKPTVTIQQDSTKFPTKSSYADNWLQFSFTDLEKEATYRAIGRIDHKTQNITGKLVTPSGTESTFTATYKKALEDKDAKEEKNATTPEVLPITYPNVGYGYAVKPTRQDVLFKNATVWTGEDAGVLENTDVLIKDGKISAIGANLSARGATVVDATGKHLTAGIIDEHSHIATLAVNESGHNSTAEVTIEDVVDPEDEDIYRNLAGGVTSIQILHGSANPIGGRSALIKLKWGEEADAMIYDNSPKFIKFALGENVKQSNWGSSENIRFPQTRMGVEQLFVNYFNRAKEYDTAKKAGKNLRYDEELEVLAEILNGERFISCHSYVQSEINMLMKVAEQFDFTVNTFTHILEGYKVADKMKEHGVGGSTFSDWWAYKYEVNDAIPYNAAIMTRAGVLTAINSDDAEMSRRLNQEAAKTVKYGGMSEEEAWKMVTINPAKLLHIDERVGSIKEGKDADVVLWNDNPLSIYAKAEKTFIEGVPYFDLNQDKAIREAVKAERAKLIAMMLADGKEGSKGKRPPMKKDKLRFECETIIQK